VSPAACMVVGKVGPGVAVLGVILAHRAPLALRQVRAPALPVLRTLGVFLEASKFRLGQAVCSRRVIHFSLCPDRHRPISSAHRAAIATISSNAEFGRPCGNLGVWSLTINGWPRRSR